SESPGSSSPRSESDAHRSITSEAATVGRNGPGVSSRPCASWTTASSASPNPEPPCSSAMARPSQPNSAAAFHTFSGFDDPPSSVARAAALVDSRVNWPIAASARSWCSSVIASADLLTWAFLQATNCDLDHIHGFSVRLVDNLRMLSFGVGVAGYIRQMTVRPDARYSASSLRKRARWLLRAGPADYVLAMSVASASLPIIGKHLEPL